jgi:hypothetical protein
MTGFASGNRATVGFQGNKRIETPPEATPGPKAHRGRELGATREH